MKSLFISWISCNFYECIRENKRKHLVLEKLAVSLQHLLTKQSNDDNNGCCFINY